MKLLEEMPPPTFLDLKPNKLLLDPKFDGYKLSLDHLPVYVTPFPNSVDRVGPAEEQYSIQHAKIFALYNCLHGDPFNPYVSFIVDKAWNISKIVFDEESNKFSPFTEVWNIPTKSSRAVGRFNVTILFPSENYAVLSDGFSTFFVLETGDRKDSNSWKVVREQKEIQEHSKTNLEKSVILDAKIYKNETDETFLDVLLLRLQDINAEKEVSEFMEKHKGQFLSMNAKHPFVSKLNWISLKKDNEKWKHECTRTLIGPSGLDYGCLENNGTALLVASENHFAFFHVTNEPLRYKTPSDKEPEGESDKPDYVWMQNSKELTILFKIPIGTSSSELNIDIRPSSMSIVLNDNVMLEGESLHKIKADETVWTISPVSVSDEESQEDGDISSSDPVPQKKYQSLEIILQKADELMWDGDSIVKSKSSGQQILDPEFVANIQERLNHLCSDKWNDDPLRAKVCDPQDLEECDTLPADTASFMRIDRDTQCISHVASLGGHQWLFSPRTHSSSIPLICIRHDVDGLLWQPSKFDSSNPEQWKLDHIGTFSAMGYVQASKQQRKFTSCSPDLSYMAICDTVKHVYIYRQQDSVDSNLRNRKTGKIVKHIAKQHVVALDPPVEILGTCFTDVFLFVLTSQNIHAIRIKEAVDE